MSGAFFIDDPTSWPSELAAVLDGALPLLRDHRRVQIEIDHLWDKRHQHPELRHRLPSNPFRAGKERLIEKLRAFLVRSRAEVVAWHCTRLCADEIATILSTGLVPLSPETFVPRVRNRFIAGDITLDTALRLMVQNQADSPSRRNQLWFLGTRGLLAASGVTNLFTWWGGEALYTCQDSDPTTGPVLAALGQPCIVEFSVPNSSATAFPGIPETLTRVFQLRSGIDDGEPPHCSGYIREPVDRTRIRRVVTTDDPAFARLTRLGSQPH